MWTYVSDAPEMTVLLGRELGALLQPGDMIALNGQLGSGKTLFVKGLAHGMGMDPDEVTSPTFAFIQEYAGSLPLYHFDVYRLDFAEQLEDLGYEDYFFGRGVTVVEWAELVMDYFPEEYLQVDFVKLDATTRRICITPHGMGFERRMQQLKERMQRC